MPKKRLRIKWFHKLTQAECEQAVNAWLDSHVNGIKVLNVWPHCYESHHVGGIFALAILYEVEVP